MFLYLGFQTFSAHAGYITTAGSNVDTTTQDHDILFP